MTKRIKNNLKITVILLTVLALVVLAIQTVWVGVNLALYTNDIVESYGSKAIYEAVNESRAEFYNSSNAYIRWLSNLDNAYRIPFGILMVFSPVLYVLGVRTYNMCKRTKKTGVY